MTICNVISAGCVALAFIVGLAMADIGVGAAWLCAALVVELVSEAIAWVRS